ncbi:MAG: hypothetical protein WCP93_02610 [Candidatus Berkelbacteria bacterium]
MTKCFLPTPVAWPSFIGPVTKKQNLEEMQVGDYLIVADYDGITGLRMDEIRTEIYVLTVLFSCGFAQKIRLPRTTVLYGDDELMSAQGNVLFSFRSLPLGSHKMNLFKNGCSGFNQIKTIFDQERPQFCLGQHKTKRVEKISIKTWPKNEPIFIVDNGRSQRVLFLQEFHAKQKLRKMVECFRSGRTNKIICDFGYVRIDGQLEVGEDLYLRSDSSGISGSVIDFVSIRVYV